MLCPCIELSSFEISITTAIIGWFDRLFDRSLDCRNTRFLRGIYADIVIVVRRPSGRATRAFRQTPASFFYFWPDPVVGIDEKTLAVRFSGVKGPARASRRFVDQVRLQDTYLSSFICICVYIYIYAWMCVYVYVCTYCISFLLFDFRPFALSQ